MFEAVLTAVQTLFQLEENAEISLEANPGASEAERFKAYRKAGINRLSIGVQSFDDKELKWLERIHSADEAVMAYAMARGAGFENINLDLMYALPHQSLQQWFKSLDQAIGLKPEHLSCYQLTVEPHTQLFASHQKQAMAFPDEDQALDFFWQTRERLQQAGFKAYEISNFAQAGKHCQHNCGYWFYDDYIGIGAGAAGKWDLDDGGVVRYSNIRSPQRYLDQALISGRAVNSDETLTGTEAMGEALWLGFRQQQGVDTNWFREHFGQSVEQNYDSLLQQWLSQGKIERDGHYIRLTQAGLILADEISASFLV